MRTIDHDTIREWVENRGWQPAVVSSTREEDGGGMLRLDMGRNARAEDLEPLSWDEFFRILDKDALAFVGEKEEVDGEELYYWEIVPRNEMELGEEELIEWNEGEGGEGAEDDNDEDEEEEEGGEGADIPGEEEEEKKQDEARINYRSYSY